MAQKRRLEKQSVIFKPGVKTEIAFEPVVIQPASEGKALNVQVKIEPIDVDKAQRNMISLTSVQSDIPQTSVPVTVKIEPDTETGSQVNQQGQSIVVMEAKQEKTSQPMDVDYALSIDDLQQEVRDVIVDGLKDENSSMSESLSEGDGSVEQADVECITPVNENRSLIEPAMTAILDDGSKIVVKQQLDDSDDEEESGEYMVLAEWTDGKLEELGASQASEEDKESEKKLKEKVGKEVQGSS